MSPIKLSRTDARALKFRVVREGVCMNTCRSTSVIARQCSTRSIAETLKAAGFTTRPGKPRKGERALKPELAKIAGKSERTISRILAGEEETRGRPRLSETGGRRTLVLSVDPELYDEVHARADAEGRSLARVGRELLRIGLDSTSRPKRKRTKRATRRSKASK